MSELERIADQIERWARFDDVAPAGLPEAAIIRKAAAENQRLRAFAEWVLILEQDRHNPALLGLAIDNAREALAGDAE